MTKDGIQRNNPGARMLQPSVLELSLLEKKRTKLQAAAQPRSRLCLYAAQYTPWNFSSYSSSQQNDVFVIFSAPCSCFLAGPLIKNNISIWLVAAGEELWDWQPGRDAGSGSCGNAWQLYSSRLVSSTGVSTESLLGRSSADRSASVASVICRWHTQTEGEWLAGARGGVCQACRNEKKNKIKIKAHPALRWRIKSVEIQATYGKFEFHTFQATFRGIKAKLAQRKCKRRRRAFTPNRTLALEFDLRCIVNVFHFGC